MVVSVAADGGVYVNDVRASMDGLAATVTGMLTDGGHEDRVVVRADKTISYEQFMKVMTALNIGGISKLSLISEVQSR